MCALYLTREMDCIVFELLWAIVRYNGLSTANGARLLI
jgi:hypothetical protein